VRFFLSGPRAHLREPSPTAIFRDLGHPLRLTRPLHVAHVVPCPSSVSRENDPDPQTATGASPFIIWVTVISFVFVVSFLYKKAQELTMASTKEIPLKDVAGHKDNVKVFLEFGISDRFKDTSIGRVEIELFSNKLPVTCENFRAFCTGEKGEGSIKGKNMHYKGVKCHRIIPGFMLQGGDHIQGDGSGGESIYGRCFADEWPDGGHVKHQKGGLLSMANSGPGTNGSQFFLTFAKAKWLDGRHVVFGQVTKGMEHLRWIEMRCGTYTGQPLQNVIIRDCGEIKGKST
jgi:peptidylprolyl isomerase